REAPVLNARIRKRWRTGNLKIGLIGEKADLTYDYAYLGAGPETLAEYVNHAPAKLERQIWLIGQGALARPDGAAILSLAPKGACRWRRAPASRPAMRARTGRFCARSPICSGSGSPMTRSASSAPRCSRRIRISRASTRLSTATRPMSKNSLRAEARPRRRH